MYSVSGEPAAVGTIDNAIAALWNPHASQFVKVIQVQIAFTAAPTAAYRIKVRRISARGTAGSTITPGIANHSLRGIAPPSGALLDLAAYSVQPTFDGDNIGPGWVFSAVASAGLIYPIPGGFQVGPGAGLALVAAATIAGAISRVTYVFLEDW